MHMASYLEGRDTAMGTIVRSFGEIAKEQQSLAGGKGGSLVRLYQAGYPVPDGFVILPTAFNGESLREEAWLEVHEQLSRMRAEKSDIAFAVRSSALSEDSAQASFAGEFESVLNVRTDDDIRKAIHTVYLSRQSERVKAYSQAKGMDTIHEIAVIIQQLVNADASGVLFTANPVTGQRDHAMLTATWGLGEAIVGGMVTPDTLIVDKETGRILKREIANKQVMTVRLGGGTEESPIPKKLRRATVLSDEKAAEIVRMGSQIEALYGMPMDIEWTLEGEKFAIVQARPITTLPEPEHALPTRWKLPKGSYMALRNNIVEMMTEPLTPLFETLGLAAVNNSMGRNMTTFLGRPGLMPTGIIVSVNQYAYYNGSLTFMQIVRILLGSAGIMKRMFTGAVERWSEAGRPRYVSTIGYWQTRPWRELPAIELLKGVRELTEAAIDAYVALVSGVIPAAWITEGLFTVVYKTLIKRRGDAPVPAYLMGFDSLPIRAEKSLYDVAEWARGCTGMVAYLNNTPTSQIAAQLGEEEMPTGIKADDWREWRSRFQRHLDNYGHAIYNLDFANPVPADDPSPLLDTLKMFVNGRGTNPHTRQQAATRRREEATQAMLKKLKGLRLKLFRKFIMTAQRYAPLREDGLFDVSLGYPLLRQMLRELGLRFTNGGMVEKADDIFWLTQDEVEQGVIKLDNGEALDQMSTVIPQRQATWRAAQSVTPPAMLPNIKLFWKEAGYTRTRSTDTIKGVAASPGRVTAPARILHGPEDFEQMKPGEVLVASITTPAWTPLFARAAAIVTDIGGPLSHGSIVAREFGIPAVLGTDTATKRIRNGQIVTVDGDSGKVFLHTNDEI
jgi:phosphohistidine swiveling domain-containing protein